jgi:trk system potassium uptake protein
MRSEVSRVLGGFLLFLGLILCLPLAVSIYYEHWLPPSAHPQLHASSAFGWTILLCASLGLLLRMISRSARGNLQMRAGIACVALIWILASVVGALPFLLSGTLHNVMDAWFESVSGLTTTGASIFQTPDFSPTGAELPLQVTIPGQPPVSYTFRGNIEPILDAATGQILFSGLDAVAKGLLFWRALMNWLGGVGIIVLFLTILPALRIGGRALFESEATGPMKEAFTPRLRKTAISLWRIYALLTLIEVILLLATNSRISLFDAITVSFATLATGGFAPSAASIGAYQSAATDWIVILFMVIGAINFGLYYQLRKGQLYRLYDVELLTFLGIVIGAALLVSLALYVNHLYDWWSALRYGTFQLVSAITTTGFFNVDYNSWPGVAQSTMLMSMFIGGMAGSTAGGLKIIRLLVLCRLAAQEIETSFRPHLVSSLLIQQRSLASHTIRRLLTFFFIFSATAALGTLALTWDGVDMRSALAATTACINNAGISFGVGSPAYSFAFLTDVGKSICIALMLLGRLEFYVLLTLLIPSFWRQR